MIERLEYVLRHYLLQPHLEMVGILDAVIWAAATNNLIKSIFHDRQFDFGLSRVYRHILPASEGSLRILALPDRKRCVGLC
jgi:hypothetical protein